MQQRWHAGTRARGHARPAPVLGLALVLGAAASVGCQETWVTARPPALPPANPPRLRPPPGDARATAVVLNVDPSPVDTNGNGYADQLFATAHVFDRRYPLPIREDGAFVFELYPVGTAGRDGATPIHSWRIEGPALVVCQARSGVGACYQFRPSLLDGGTDRLLIADADLVCRFEPADGRAPVYAGEVATLQVGRRVLIPQPRWREITEPVPAPAPAAPNEQDAAMPE